MNANLSQAIQMQFDVKMDAAVQEVFETMLGEKCSAADLPRLCAGAGSISVLIGLAGVITGACILQTDASSSRRIANLLAGSDETNEEIVKDALGEVCNMVAGAWKRSVAELTSGCMLSTPTVISGQDYDLHSRPEHRRMQRYYSGCGTDFAFAMQCVVAE